MGNDRSTRAEFLPDKDAGRLRTSPVVGFAFALVKGFAEFSRLETKYFGLMLAKFLLLGELR